MQSTGEHCSVVTACDTRTFGCDLTDHATRHCLLGLDGSYLRVHGDKEERRLRRDHGLLTVAGRTPIRCALAPSHVRRMRHHRLLGSSMRRQSRVAFYKTFDFQSHTLHDYTTISVHYY